MIAVPLFAHGPDNNMRNYWYAHDHAQNILTCLLPDSIIFPSGDHNTFPLLYLIYVEGIRSDVTVADKYGYIDLALYRDMPNNPGKPRTPEERDEIERWIIRTGHRPVYYTIKKPPLVENAEMIPVGLVYHLLPDGKPRPFRIPWESLYYRNLEGLATPEDLAAMNIIADYYYSRGMAELVSGNIHSAKTYFGQSLHHAWGMKEIYNNVASALAEFDQLDDAIGYYEEAAKMQWDYTPARWNLAKIFKSLGKYDWSAKVFEDLTRATPGDFRPYGELGFLYRDHLADIGQARYWWLQSLRRNPDQEQIILALADHEDSTSLDCREPSTRSRNRATTQSANASDQSREDP